MPQPELGRRKKEEKERKTEEADAAVDGITRCVSGCAMWPRRESAKGSEGTGNWELGWMDMTLMRH